MTSPPRPRGGFPNGQPYNSPATSVLASEIAADLVISHRTVQNHVQNILGKLHLHNRVELTRFAISRGLDKPE